MTAHDTTGAISRITREYLDIQKGGDLSLAVTCQDENVLQMRALVMGPSGTPYEYGFFEFTIEFEQDYPLSPPSVQMITTNDGCCRFNPNIYACGKVCLSILGTWLARKDKSWSGAQGLESVLISIQSLLNDNPHQNEPGFEDTEKESNEAQSYNSKIRHETLRITIIQRLEKLLNLNSKDLSSRPRKRTKINHHEFLQGSRGSSECNAAAREWNPFANLIKQKFLWYYDSYCHAVAKHATDQNDGTRFEITSFEDFGNEMSGRFQYNRFHKRLETIRISLETEISGWAVSGLQLAQSDSSLASRLQFILQQLQHSYSQQSRAQATVELSLPDPKNPFQWTIVMFGRSATNLENGVLRLTMTIPPDFPERQPHVKMEVPIFHHRISLGTGTVCYVALKPEDLESHLEAIISTLEDESTPFDPRLVITPEVFDLRWGDDDSRCQYYRRLRRSVQDTLET